MTPDPSAKNPYRSPATDNGKPPADSTSVVGLLRSAVQVHGWKVVVLWFFIVLVSGTYAGNHGTHSVIGGVGAFICVALLLTSLRGLWHFVALPLYGFFALEILAASLHLLRVALTMRG
ncbi:hypothetical protein NG895_15180 [Aeoliella sp. ICT_H6.2]|uniref:Uncharacterized protein n=1 Tax=Aeoliella straminimaris TaxID=2954799 RepID=A0A9X2JI37_9BACT|nr:hypothetical protein [Aeoliella straminimaris]MCO6045253.1 hypothetical protein [Aeoliella straminimaris]